MNNHHNNQLVALPKIVTYPNFLIVDVLVTTRLTVLVFLSDFGILF